MGRRLWLLLLIVVLAPGAAVAQDFRGAITGRIADKSGAVLPGVTVTATNVATNVGSTTTTNSDGVYSILYLTPGQYTVVAELSGDVSLEQAHQVETALEEQIRRALPEVGEVTARATA